ncbi:MAG: type II toxin-antitoxin system VapC family toxin [Thermoplasmatota archaeon]
MPVLDTNFIIACALGDPGAVQLLSSMAGENVVVPSIVAVEYVTPFGPHHEGALAALEKSFTLAHTSRAWVLAAGRLRQELHARRKTIRLADFWISAWAVLEDTYVVTRNVRDFEALGVKTRTW